MSETATPPPLPPHLSSKERFLSQTEVAKQWRDMSRSDLLLNVLTHSLSEYCLTNTPTQEQVKAVRDFIDTTLNLGEPRPSPRAPFPERRLAMPSLENSKEEKSK